MSTVLILGAGRGQLPLFGICQNLGYDVVFATPRGDYPGIGKTPVYYTDVRDYRAVTEIARETGAVAVVSDQLDAGIYSCAYASEELGLIGIGTEVAQRFTDKAVMRACARAAGVATPRFEAVRSLEEAVAACESLGFPLMMKPSDNASSRGVFLVGAHDELRAHFEESKGYSTGGVVVLEQFVEGREYVVESYTKGGETQPLIVGHRDYFDIPGKFIPRATVFRDARVADSPVERKVMEADAKLVKAFGLPFGITHGEYLYNAAEDEVYLVEIAARGGGEFISDALIPLSCGVRANEMLVHHVLGLDYDIEKHRLGRASAYFSYLLPEGVVSSISGIDAVAQLPGVYDAMFDNVSLGLPIAPVKDKASRKGPLLVQGATKDECYSVRDAIERVLDIQVETPEGARKGIIWR